MGSCTKKCTESWVSSCTNPTPFQFQSADIEWNLEHIAVLDGTVKVFQGMDEWCG